MQLGPAGSSATLLHPRAACDASREIRFSLLGGRTEELRTMVPLKGLPTLLTNFKPQLQKQGAVFTCSARKRTPPEAAP